MELINGSAADATRDNADKVNQFSGRVSEEVLRIDTECYRRIFKRLPGTLPCRKPRDATLSLIEPAPGFVDSLV